MVFKSNQLDDLAVKLFEKITSIQCGLSEDEYNWLTPAMSKEVEV
jgi:hypothetical protein